MTRDDEQVREIVDKDAFLAVMMRQWGSHRMMIGLRLYDCAELPLLGLFSAEGRLLAAASWSPDGEIAVLCALHALTEGQGAAVRLLEQVKIAARRSGARKLRAMLTNDNMPGLAFYQKQGFRFSALYVEAIDTYRSVIPTIIKTGYQDIPVRDALELEIGL
ncbi:GNAT family N-acetyltransferase [Bosea sp. TWI1241]|jgi:GNAT superfamily N-acetyltransferase|uniref:GNAT family N-acetyltransferase n=1 Tax=Bosea sp. TWI1241 TaxID=3148904 RepID=UPI00320B5EA1